MAASASTPGDERMVIMTMAVGLASLVLLLVLAWRQRLGRKHTNKCEPYQLWGCTVNVEIPKDVFAPSRKLEELDELFDFPQHGYFTGTFEQKQLHYRANVIKKPKAIVVWQHGIHGHSGYGMKKKSNGQYTQLALRARLFREAGLAIYAHDQLGHGFSEGERFLIPNGGDWRVNRDDLIAFVKFVAAQHDPDTPLFIIGDSYGGCVALHAARHFQDYPCRNLLNFKGMVLNCPAVIGDLPPPPVVFILRFVLAPLFPRWTPSFMPHPVNPDRIWKDAEARAHHTDKSLTFGLSFGGQPFCLGTAVGLLKATEAVRTQIIPTLTVPFQVNHGTRDFAVPMAGAEYLMKHAQTKDKTFNPIEGGFHDLGSGNDAKDIMSRDIAWILERSS